MMPCARRGGAEAPPHGAGDLAAEGRADLALEMLDDALLRPRYLLVGEGVVGGLVGDGEGERLLARAHLLARVDVEQPHLAPQGRPPGDGLDSACREALIDCEGDVLGYRREAGDRLIAAVPAHEGQTLVQ